MDQLTDLASLLVLTLLIGLASFRLSRLVATDTIFQDLRLNIQTWLMMTKEGDLRTKGVRYNIAYLIGCEFCAGVWVSGLVVGLVSIFLYELSISEALLIWFAAAGLQVTLISSQD
jgi:hypothetical protein